MMLNHLKTPDINKGTGNDKKLFFTDFRNNQVLMPEKVPESEMATQSYPGSSFFDQLKRPFYKYGNNWIIFQRLNHHIIKYYK